MNRDLNINIIHRYLADECSPEEIRHIRNWLETDPRNREAMKALKKIWDVQPQKELESDVQVAWNKLEERLNTNTTDEWDKSYRSQEHQGGDTIFKNRHFRSHTSSQNHLWFRVAAIIVLGLLCTLFFVDFDSMNSAEEQTAEVAMREVSTNRGHQSQVTFNDGSKVVLNAESRIVFPERFVNDVREVILEGEAYFEVKHNPDKEFVVHTSEAQVRVLGTKFNVKARSEEQKVEVAVAQGKVSVQSKIEEPSTDDTQVVVLVENEMSVVRSGFAPTGPQPVKTSSILGWLAGDFVFDEVPFSKVLREWERRFDVEFAVEDTALLSVRFSGEFRREPLIEMLWLSSQSLNFNYVRDGQLIMIKADKE